MRTIFCAHAKQWTHEYSYTGKKTQKQQHTTKKYQIKIVKETLFSIISVSNCYKNETKNVSALDR